MPIRNPQSPVSDFINRQWAASHIYVPGRAAERVRQEQAKIARMGREALAARSSAKSSLPEKVGNPLAAFAFWGNAALAWLIYSNSGEALYAIAAAVLGLVLLKIAESSSAGRFCRVLIHLALIAAPIILLGF